mmetsp:Transcript_10298/g.18197  ORF Transcript_10298/g.18197 Transcript_10298/m.18197 type:complete len:546 (+) Transcript_10298:111-1748(+)
MMSFHTRIALRHYLATCSKLQKTPLKNPLNHSPQRRFFTADGNGASKQRLRRSVHFIPADNDKFLSKSLSLGADTIILDLEDSVKDKEVGREKLRAFLRSENNMPGRRDTTEVLVRINPLSSSGGFGREIWREDIDAGFFGADGFMVPKVESRDELRMLDEVLTNMEKNNAGFTKKVLLPIATETPAAVLNIADIARGPRVCAITWGCEDLSAEIGSFGTRKPDGGYLDIFRHCQSMCLLAAKAANIQAIDGIYQNVRDMAGFEKEASDSKYMGFDGKLTLHPEQISAVHRVFEPTQAELKDANAIVTLWEGGDGLEYNGKMIDLPHYVRAKKVIARSSSRDGAQNNNDKMSKDTTISMSDGGETKQTSSPSGEDENEIFPRVYLGKYFDDLNPGLKIRHFLTRTVTEADNVFFTCLTLNPAPIHLDHELSKGNSSGLSSGSGTDTSGAGKPLFNSMFTLALLVGMSIPETTHGTTVANLGFSEVLFPKPVYPGDTLRAETMVLDRRESKSRPTQGIVTFQHLAYNQRGEVVCKATRQALMKKRS